MVKRIFKIVSILLVTIFVVLLALGSSIALGFGYMRLTGNNVISENPEGNTQSKEIKSKESITVLILGMNQNLSDFIMLAKYDPNTGKTSLLSIPRDTKYNGLSEPHNTYYKINAVYQNKHIDKIIEKVEKLVDVKIDKYLVFDHKALWNIVDAIGGVEVEVPLNMNYDDPEQNLHIHIKKGKIKLDGKTAEGFVRFRKNNDRTGYPGGDIQRIKTQQQFIKQFISECLKPSKMILLPGIAKDLISDVKTNITIDSILYYLEDIATFSLDKVNIATLPGTDKTLERISFYIKDDEKTKELVDEMFNN